MSRTSGYLQDHAQRLGLSTQGKREVLMDRIRDFLIQQNKLDVVEQIEPMLAHNAKDFLDYTLDKPWRSAGLIDVWNHPDVDIEPKLDGVRVKAHFNPRYGRVRFDSRRRSDVDYIYSEKTENFPYLQIDTSQLPAPCQDMILDGEFIPPEPCKKIWNGAMWVEGLQIVTSIWNSGQAASLNLQQNAQWECGGQVINGVKLNYHVFDVIKWNGHLVTEAPRSERKKIIRRVMELLSALNPHWRMVEIWEPDCGDRLAMFEHELDRGGEGVMMKHVGFPYEIGKRVHHQLKLKRFISVDCFVTGYVPATEGKGWEGMIGAFELSCMGENGPVHVASCSSMTLEERRAASMPDGSLNPIYLGKVAEVRFQQLTSRSNRGRHAVLVRWREDKSKNECTMDQIVDAPSEMTVDYA